MPKLPGVNHLHAVRALEKAGFWIARQGRHIVMTDGIRIITVPRHNPINPITMIALQKPQNLIPLKKPEMQGAKFSRNEAYLAYAAVTGKLKQRRRSGFFSGIITMGNIVRDSGLTNDDFCKLL